MLLPDRAGEPLGERDDRSPGLAVVDPRAPDERRARRAVDELGELCDDRRIGGPRADDPARRGALSRRCGLGRPVVHRNDHERRPASGHGLVGGPCDGRRHALRAHRVVDPHRVVPGEPLQPPGEERLRGDVAAVLLPDEDDERHPVDARRGEGADRVAEARRRVQDREGGLSASDRPARRHPDDGALVEAEHEPQVARQVGQQLDLGRARVCEQRGKAVLPEDVEGGVTHGRGTMATLLEVI